ncbi:MAG: HD-GYP domain-containing protein [Anaerolineae bacterium]
MLAKTMRHLPIALQAYIAGVILSSGLVLGLFLPALVDTRLSQIALAAVAAFTMAFAETHRIPISYRSAVTVTVGISFAAILLLGAALATWTTAVGWTIAYGYLNLYLKRRKWYNGAFNVGVAVLMTAASALVYENISRDNTSLLLSPQNVVASFAAGVTYFVINSGLVAVVVALRRRRDPWYTWASLVKQTAAEYLTLILLAILMAVTYNYRWWALILIVPPIIIVYHSLRTSQELRVQTIEAVLALADAIESRDPYAFEHSRRVAGYAEGIARELRLPTEEIETISLSARVHDLGKVGIRDELLYKPGKFTAEERLAFQQHVRIGAEIVERFPRYRECRDIILGHHEHYDGNGYLKGLRGNNIPIGARIISVADAYDAMTTDRPYRPALTPAEAIDELKRCSGSQFDPGVVGAFLKYLDDSVTSEQ